MTTGTEPAQPNPQDQPPPTAPATEPQAQGLDFTDPQPVDHDDIELRDAIAAAKAEAPKGESAPADAAPGIPDAPAPAAAKPPDQRQPSPMIPKARLDEALSKAEKAERGEAYWRGVAEGRIAPAAQPGQPSPPATAPTPEQRLAEIDQAVDAVAKKFDDGEITYSDLKREERALTRKADAIREEVLVAKVSKTPSEPQQGGDALYLENLTAQLEHEHPWVNVFEQVGSAAEWGYLKTRATENLVARGIDPTQGTLGRYELRREIAVLSDELGPALLKARATQAGIALPGQQPSPPTPPQAPQPPPLTPGAQARAVKLQQQQQAPPDLTSMQGSGANTGAVTDSQFESMDEEAIGRLPDAVRRKALGLS